MGWDDLLVSEAERQNKMSEVLPLITDGISVLAEHRTGYPINYPLYWNGAGRTGTTGGLRYRGGA